MARFLKMRLEMAQVKEELLHGTQPRPETFLTTKTRFEHLERQAIRQQYLQELVDNSLNMD